MLEANKIYHGDNLKILPLIDDNSIDSIVTDPQYGWSFMGKDWDKALPPQETYNECFRVLKHGAFMFWMSGARFDCLIENGIRIRNAGFIIGFSSIYWAYAGGFPKSLNISKNISKDIDKKFNTNDVIEWYMKCQEMKLSIAKDAERKYLIKLVEEKDIIQKRSFVQQNVQEKQWENQGEKQENSKIVNGAVKKYEKNLTEIGTNIMKKDFVVENVQQITTQKNKQLNANIVKKNLKEVQVILKENIYIVVENVDIKQKQLLFNVIIVKKVSQDHNHRLSNLKIISVPIIVQISLCEKIKERIKEEEAQKIWDGNVRFWQKMGINVLCVEMIENLKLTILNQLKNIQNLDMKFQMEELTATNVIIIKSITECLITNMVSILVKELKEKTKHLEGSTAGFQPKPAVEVVIVAMKPLDSKTFVEQALKNKKGITWLDDCRIPYDSEKENTHRIIKVPRFSGKDYAGGQIYDPRDEDGTWEAGGNLQGRFPANLLVSDDILNDGVDRKGKWGVSKAPRINSIFLGDKYSQDRCDACNKFIGDSGSFSRYFDLDKWFSERIKKLPKEIQKTFPFLIVPKSSKSEKNLGLDNLEAKNTANPFYENLPDLRMKRLQKRIPNQNIHPTCKPLKLMSYLILLGSREGDIILDPFIGSGTTAIACRLLVRNFIGIEIEKEYLDIATTRVTPYMEQKTFEDFF